MLNYIPRWVHQPSEKELGSLVTHEDYNAKLNLNGMQGDYNTHVLLKLFTSADPEDVYHIPYLDKEITGLKDSVGDIPSVNETLRKIISGETSVGVARLADNLTGAATAGTKKYYGTDASNAVGFHTIPDGIFAEGFEEGSVEVEGIYYIPRENSVAESMLTEDVRTKLNRSVETSYNSFTDKPSIEGVELIGDVSLATLDLITATAISQQYTTLDSLELFSTMVNNRIENVSNVAESKARVFVNSVPENTTLKAGDLLVIV